VRDSTARRPPPSPAPMGAGNVSSMCGRFAMDDTVNELVTEFVVSTGRKPEDGRPGWEPSWNISPTENIPLLFQSARGGGTPEVRFEPAYWSLVPGWSKTLKLKASTFNARAEDIAEKPLWRKPVQSHRAVVFDTRAGTAGWTASFSSTAFRHRYSLTSMATADALARHHDLSKRLRRLRGPRRRDAQGR
jgi:putative SOS response-associated peptidase YedK